jgi:hypothetical protein
MRHLNRRARELKEGETLKKGTNLLELYI